MAPLARTDAPPVASGRDRPKPPADRFASARGLNGRMLRLAPVAGTKSRTTFSEPSLHRNAVPKRPRRVLGLVLADESAHAVDGEPLVLLEVDATVLLGRRVVFEAWSAAGARTISNVFFEVSANGSASIR